MPGFARRVLPFRQLCWRNRTEDATGTVIASDTDLAKFLVDDAGVGTVAGEAFGASPFLRVVYAVPLPVLRRAWFENCPELRVFALNGLTRVRTATVAHLLRLGWATTASNQRRFVCSTSPSPTPFEKLPLQPCGSPFTVLQLFRPELSSVSEVLGSKSFY